MLTIMTMIMLAIILNDNHPAFGEKLLITSVSIFILIFCKGPTVIGVKLLWYPSFFNAVIVRCLEAKHKK